MKQAQLVRFIGLLAIVVVSVCHSIAFAGTFTVRGTLIADDQESSVNSETSRSPLEEVPVKVIIREGGDTSQPSSTVLVSGKMQKGEISLVGEIDTATTGTISVDVGKRSSAGARRRLNHKLACIVEKQSVRNCWRDHRTAGRKYLHI